MAKNKKKEEDKLMGGKLPAKNIKWCEESDQLNFSQKTENPK